MERPHAGNTCQLTIREGGIGTHGHGRSGKGDLIVGKHLQWGKWKWKKSLEVSSSVPK